jgi:Bifunctional DNA primase/polymerase, N-terminal/AAA domain
MTDTAIVSQGIAYAKRGWAVFPVNAKTKRPLIDHWPNRATTNPKSIRATWGPNPWAGMGIVTGNGLVVVDLDVKQGIDGPGNFADYLSNRGITLPQTMTVRTRSGGEHRYYRVPEGAEYFNSAGKIAPGVDLRGTGGFVVAPPTEGYSFISDEFDGVLPELPAGVLPEKTQPAVTTEPREKHSREYAYAAFSGGLDDLENADEGSRNDTLNRVAYNAARDGLDPATVKGMLRVRGLAAGLSEGEIRATIESAFGKPDTDSAPSLLSGPWGGPYQGFDELLAEASAKIPTIWGPAESPLWSKGESLMLAGDVGVGKSTLAVELVVARLGMVDTVLGYPVEPDGGRVLYVAADRPKQILRGLPRTMGTGSVGNRMVFRMGALPVGVDLGDPECTEWLLNEALSLGATTVVVDSIKDVLSNPADALPAGAYNKARQRLVSNGVELIEIHHNRKTDATGKGNRSSVDAIFGSRWLTAGAGSILTLVKDKPAGDNDGDNTADESSIVLLRQVKEITEPIAKMRLTLDRPAGRLIPANEPESLTTGILSVLFIGGKPMNVAGICAELFPEGAVPADVKRVQRTLSRLAEQGKIQHVGRGLYRG